MKRPKNKLLCAALTATTLTLCLPGLAAADNIYGGSTAEPVSDRIDRAMTLSISAPHLIAGPIYELQVEFDASPSLSLAGIGGWGHAVTDADDTRVKLDVWNAGGQLRYLAEGNFDKNIHLGVEVMYTDVQDGPGDDALGLFVHRRGVAVSPFVGGKFTTEIGFTAEAQVGFGYEGLGGEADAGAESTSRFVPIANLNVGWSF